MTNVCKCGSTDMFIEQRGSATGLYCNKCGKWQKWLNKNEIRVFEHNQKPKKVITNADRIRNMTDDELAGFIIESRYIIYEAQKETNDILMKIDFLRWLQEEVEE